jgi:tRNA A-37 threonylcarbamoyl transferase component Bud32
VRVPGRDAQDTQRADRRWRLLAYRDPPRSSPVGRLEQVEHEALTTLLATQVAVRVPEVVAVGMGPEGDAVLVTRQPDVAPLELASPDQVSDGLLEALWRQVALLHVAGISHGRLNASNVMVVDGEPMLVDFSAATLGAPQSALEIDVAELLVACCVLVGPDRTLATALDAGWADSVARVLPYLQWAALTPHLRDLARTHEVGLKELRAAVAAATGVPEPELVHDRVVPGVKSALSGLWSVARDRRKRVELFGGTAASELLYAISLGATCLAYGVHLNVAQLVFVNTSAAVLSGLIPVPGGIGAAEAAISAGLIAMGVDESTAFAVALTQRLCTFYLPPIWGYFGLRWLERKSYV